MATYDVNIDYKQLLYDARANSWKAGRIAPREDGLHGETQMSQGDMDTKIAARLMVDASNLLLEVLQDFRFQEDEDSYVPGTLAEMLEGFGDATFYGEVLLKANSRSNADSRELDALVHEFLLGYVMAGWYKLVNPQKINSWRARQEDAKTRLLAALRNKREPV